MMKPKVTAIVLSYNHEYFIEKALDSVYSQNYENFEIIIHDDASTDQTVENILNYIDSHKPLHEHVNIQFLTEEKNKGLIKSYNKCLKLAKGEIIVGFSGDDISYSNRITKSVELLLRYNVSLVACDAIIIDEIGNTLTNSVYNRNHVDLFDRIGSLEDDIRIITKDNFPTRLISIGGFGYTYWKSIINCFDYQLPIKCNYEDEMISLIAMWNKGIVFSYEPFVKKRRTSNSITRSSLMQDNYLLGLQVYKEKEIELYEEKISFLKSNKAGGNVNNEVYINRINKGIIVNTIEINSMLNLRWQNWSCFYSVLMDTRYAMRFKLKLLFYICFPFTIKAKLKNEFYNRLNY